MSANAGDDDSEMSLDDRPIGTVESGTFGAPNMKRNDAVQLGDPSVARWSSEALNGSAFVPGHQEHLEAADFVDMGSDTCPMAAV